MWYTANQTEMRDLLKTFDKDNRAIYGDHVYSAGYFTGMIMSMMNYLPEQMQKEFISDMYRETARSRDMLNELQSEDTAV